MPLLLSALNPSPMTGLGNNTWLLDGPEPALIDAGVGVPAHIDSIASAISGRALRRVLITHSHADHCSGIPALRERWPGLEICVSEKWAGDAAPVAERTRRLKDRDEVLAGDRMLGVICTPGHAIDHICFWDESSRDLYAGDMIVRGSTVMIPATRGGGLRAYLSSLERLAAIGPARVYSGHGPVIDNPAELIAEYIEHRRMRDAQVAACVADGIAEPDAIVSRIYPDLAADLRPAARATVEAHLQKLREDGL